MNLMKSFFRAARKARRCPWFSVGLLAAGLIGYVIHAWMASDSRSLRRMLVVEPLERYDPGTAYQIAMSPKWRETGRTVSGVPVVEPADEKTRELAERVLGPDAAEGTEFLYVGEIGKVRSGADVYVVSEPEMPEIEMPQGSRIVDLTDVNLPEGVPSRRPTRLILVARPPPLFDWRVLHRVEADWEWRPDVPDVLEWEIDYRPYEVWIKGRVYVFVEVGYHQRAGESGAFGRGGAGVCPGRDCP